MNEEHFMLVSIDDDVKSKVIADVLGNKTCKKLISYFTQVNEASENDLAQALKMPINTVEYNLKKLIEAGFVQKKQNFFWSKKGKKIVMYELTNKSIILSPKKSTLTKLKSVIPAILFSAVGSFSIWVFEKINSSKLSNKVITEIARDNTQLFLAKAGEGAQVVSPSLNTSSVSNLISNPHLWIYFLFGSVVAIIIISVLNWRKL